MKTFQSDSITELAAALSKAQGEITHAGKDAENPYFKSMYADLPAVIDAAKPSLAKHGLSVVQFTDVDEKGEVVLVTQLIHSSGQWIRGFYPVNPVKRDPQGFGSAMTYARRYAFSAITGVAAANEDDDGNAASGNKGSRLDASETDPRKPKSQFNNAALRKTFQTNVTTNFHNAKTLDELNELMELDKPKLEAMRISGAEADQLSVEEIGKQYSIAKTRLQTVEFEQRSSDDLDQRFKNVG